jgi:glycosyltransferase involved in cell wall biosynthesis
VSNPLVSVIIPCYNVSQYIGECVDSVINQTHSPIEIICVDNNSGDNTFEILKELEGKYDNLQVHQEFAKGASAARNKGLSFANGSWIQFLDADDLLLPNKISHQLKMVDAHPKTDFIAAASRKENLTQDSIEKKVEKDEWKALFSTSLGNTCSNLFRKSSIIDAGLWNESLDSSQESELMYRLLKNHSKVLIDQSINTIIRVRSSGQISQGNFKGSWGRYVELRSQIIEFLKDKKAQYYEENRSFFEDSFFKILRILAQKNTQSASEYFDLVLGKDYQVKGENKLYMAFHKLIGFKAANRLTNFTKKLIPFR